jgi:hypothetical protein
MRAVTLIAYVVLAMWSIVSSLLRVLILLGSGAALDPLPFVGSALGVLALVGLAAARRLQLLGPTTTRKHDEDRPRPL